MHRYFHPRGSSPWTFPLRIESDRFPRSTQEPEPRSRRLYAGHHRGRKQVTPRTCPRPTTPPGFDVVHTLSTLHRRFTCVRLLDPHLTRVNARPFPKRSPPAFCRSSFRWFGTLILQPDSEGPTLISYAARLLRSNSMPEPSSRAVVAHSHQRTGKTSVRAAPAPGLDRSAKCSTAMATVGRPAASPPFAPAFSPSRITPASR